MVYQERAETDERDKVRNGDPGGAVLGLRAHTLVFGGPRERVASFRHQDRVHDLLPRLACS